MNDVISENERIDDLQCKGYRIIQNTACFCFGMDAVLLSSFATAGKNASVLDLCSGNGVIPILMHAKNPQTKYVGIEIQDVAFNLAQRNASLNNISGDVVFVQGNIKEITAVKIIRT